MKRKFLMTLALSLSLTAFAMGANAERYLSSGSYSAYIGENDYTYVVFPSGVTKMLEQPSRDLLSMTDTQVILLTQDNKLYAINLNESNTTVEMLSNSATQDAWKTACCRWLARGRSPLLSLTMWSWLVRTARTCISLITAAQR